MPIIACFSGIVLVMHYEKGEKHNRPHIHASYSGKEAVLDFNGKVLAGKLPPKQLNILKAWIKRHEKDLQENWKRACKNEQIFRIGGD